MAWAEYFYCLWGSGRQRITRDWRIVLKKENGKKAKREGEGMIDIVNPTIGM